HLDVPLRRRAPRPMGASRRRGDPRGDGLADVCRRRRRRQGSDDMNPFGPGCPWWDLHERFGEPNVKWCEERLCAMANEPANTWSNLGYLVVGAAIFAAASRAKLPLGRAFG